MLGHDLGRLRTWLCNDLCQAAVHDLAVPTAPCGLLPDRPGATRFATRAGARTDTEPVAWFAAAPAVHD
ncbi:hypothetical protein [Kitasatospora sp. NPDC004272]